MRKFKVIRGKPILFDEKDEIFITKCIADLIKKKKHKLIEYNICKDHIHFVIFCEQEKLESIIQNIKSVTSRRFKENSTVSKLWAQKFNRRIITNEKQLANVLDYVRNNRVKHNLEENKELMTVIDHMLTPLDKLID